MPKIDIASLPIDSRTNYPEPFNRVVIGRSRKRLGVAAGLDQFGVNLTRSSPVPPRHCGTGTKGKTSLSICLKARWC